MIISIDGASRRNGKPDCRAAGGIFVDTGGTFTTRATHKNQATNQQGEIVGLISALTHAVSNITMDTVYIITDSEYVYNAITKDWITNWYHKGWVNAENNPVKSKDLWQRVAALQEDCLAEGIEVMVYHIKGHLVSIGKVTARKSLEADPTGLSLYKMAWHKYDQIRAKKPEIFASAMELFERNHGFYIEEEMFKNFVCMNTVADYVAGTYLDKVEAGELPQ